MQESKCTGEKEQSEGDIRTGDQAGKQNEAKMRKKKTVHSSSGAGKRARVSLIHLFPPEIFFSLLSFFSFSFASE